jgi:hypothetical protein
LVIQGGWVAREDDLAGQCLEQFQQVQMILRSVVKPVAAFRGPSLSQYCPHHLLGLPDGVLWLEQVFSNAGLAYHAITLICLFTTREGFSNSSFYFFRSLSTQFLMG